MTIGLFFGTFSYMKEKKQNKTTDEIASMFLGLVIVGAVVLIMFNIFNRVKGRVDIPGISDQPQLELTGGEVKVSNENEKVIASEEGGVYRVQAGDSLWKIAAAKYGDGYKWTEIAKTNNLKNPGVLTKGQELTLPKLETSKPVASEESKSDTETIAQAGEYTVVRGDSLWKIAVKAYADGYQWPAIWQENKTLISNPGFIEIGMKLKLPEVVTGK